MSSARSRRQWGKTVAQSRKADTTEPYAAEKVAIRRSLLDAVGPEQAAVFDAFAGAGRMFDDVWHRAGRYVGCDTRWIRDGRTAYVADNRIVMRAIDLSPFNVFDLDAYGSPWHQVLILAHRRPLKLGERIGLAITDGSSFKLRLGSMPRDLSALVGLRMNTAGTARGGKQLVVEATRRASAIMGGEITRAWSAQGKTGAQVIYAGFVIEQRLVPGRPTVRANPEDAGVHVRPDL